MIFIMLYPTNVCTSETFQNPPCNLYVHQLINMAGNICSYMSELNIAICTFTQLDEFKNLNWIALHE